METDVTAVLGAVVIIAVLATIASGWSERHRRVESAVPEPSLPRGVGDVLAVLRSIAVIVDASDTVVNTSATAVSHRLVRQRRLVHDEVRGLTALVRRDGVIREVELDLPRGNDPEASVVMQVRVAPLGGSHVLVLAEDLTHARRVEEMRRDFLANVSHELKTPVGGISLLAEAVLEAREDPVAVARFAERIRGESTRLGQLVQEIVDLSHIQVADTLQEPELVDVTGVVCEAVERLRVAAQARSITLTSAGEGEHMVFGNAELLVTAVANLIANAVAYSDAGTRVGIGVRRDGEHVEVTVTDQGIGIPATEQERIFERFYRVDAARSRATGGTGLGLAIVKHVCANHGGEVLVWSEPGHGSTFTVRLPVAASPDEPSPVHPNPNVGGVDLRQASIA